MHDRESREFITMETSSNGMPIVLYDHVKFAWLEAWEKLDIFSEGKISLLQMENFLLHSNFGDHLPDEAITNLLHEADVNRDGFISKEEFIRIIQNTKSSRTLNRYMRKAAFYAIPKSARDVHIRRYIDEYSCVPPPIFIPTITLAQICCFIYYAVELDQPVTSTGPVPYNSSLIYNPTRRNQAWRFFTYMFIHAGWVHLFNNMLMQIMLGIILELVHKSLRVSLVYSLGVIGGCLAASLTYPYYFLAGASGGVYALEYAYLGNLIMNWAEMDYPFIQLAFIVTISIFDVSYAVWDTLSNLQSNTSYVAHLGGAVTGLLMGVNVLRNLEKQHWENYCWNLSLAILTCLFVAAIGFHIGATNYFPLIT